MGLGGAANSGSAGTRPNHSGSVYAWAADRRDGGFVRHLIVNTGLRRVRVPSGETSTAGCGRSIRCGHAAPVRPRPFNSGCLRGNHKPALPEGRNSGLAGGGWMLDEDPDRIPGKPAICSDWRSRPMTLAVMAIAVRREPTVNTNFDLNRRASARPYL
jgi:hypothetical protein